jgi:hypothetical protein
MLLTNTTFSGPMSSTASAYVQKLRQQQQEQSTTAKTSDTVKESIPTTFSLTADIIPHAATLATSVLKTINKK